MEWQLSQPGMAPIGQCFGRMLAAAVESIKPMFQVVRACNLKFRQSRQALSKRAALVRRVPVPAKLHPSEHFTAVEVIAPITERKRRWVVSASASASGQRNEDDEDRDRPMRPAKRRHFDFDTPWKDQAWMKEHLKDLTPPEISSTTHIVAPHESPVIRRSPSKRFGYKPRFEPYPRSPRRENVQMDKVIHLYREDPNVMQFLWTSDDEDERSPSPEPTSVKEEVLSQENNMKTEQESVPVTPNKSKMPTPPPSDSEADWDPYDEADPEAARRWRKFLRDHPESVNARGFKVPIDGIISPETQAWNEQHEKELREAEQQTPSKPPPEDPAKQLAGLTLREPRTPPQPLRTPKARSHQSVRTDRKTRAQKLFEEREARNDAYKLVPLSKEWDAKVRHAVQQGVKDNEGYTKYNDTDLARVVPHYARGGVHDNWLNDAVVNDYITLCVKHGNKDDRHTQVPTFAAFSSQTWQKIQSDPRSIPTRWWKRQGIQGKRALACNTIFMPINTGSHWTLAVIHPKVKNITMYNSMGYGRNQAVAETILKFMKQEVGASLIEDEWTINARGLSPQQRNSDDCGVFSITTARQLVLGKMEKEPYTADIIPVQRKRIVAELVNEGLLSTEDSEGDGSVKGKEK